MKTVKTEAHEFVSGVVGYLQNEKLGEKTLPKIQTLLTRISTVDRQAKEALVETSVVLNLEEKQNLEILLSKLIGHTVHFIYKINRDLLGGLRVVMGDWVIDTSFKKQLELMAQGLL